MWCVLGTAYYVLCTVYWVLCAVYCVLRTEQRIVDKLAAVRGMEGMDVRPGKERSRRDVVANISSFQASEGGRRVARSCRAQLSANGPNGAIVPLSSASDQGPLSALCALTAGAERGGTQG